MASPLLKKSLKAVVAADPSLVAALPQIEWSLLSKMRDKVTHQYWAIDQAIVWATAEKDIAKIRQALRAAPDDLK